MRRGLQNASQTTALHTAHRSGTKSDTHHFEKRHPMKELTEDEFSDQFTVIDGPDGESIRDNHKGIEPDSKHLWTILDVDGSLYAASGLHFVNRFGYLVTEEAWDEETEAVWHAASEEEDGDEESDDGA